MQFCSDTEDFFGDYDSLLDDSSLLAKLDDAERDERRRELQVVDQQDLAARPPPTDCVQKRPCPDVLTDSILDILGDEPFQDLPASQMQFEEQMGEGVKRNKLQDGDTTSTPSRNAGDSGHRRTPEAGTDGHTDGNTRRRSRARRSVTDQLKRTMLCNAAAPSNVSRSVVLKEAVVSKEISVAMQAMETVSTETTDLGPFFGLPSKVKDLMYKLRGIKSLYGEGRFHYGFFRLCKRVQTKRSSQFHVLTSNDDSSIEEFIVSLFTSNDLRSMFTRNTNIQ